MCLIVTENVNWVFTYCDTMVFRMASKSEFVILKRWFIRRMNDFLFFDRIVGYDYAIRQDVSFGDFLTLVCNNHELFLNFIITERMNFLLTCKFLIMFPEFRGESLYDMALEYVLLSQRRNGLWIIEPSATRGDGDVRSDLIIEPTLYGLAAMYANRDRKECLDAFIAAWNIVSKHASFWGHGYDALGTTAGIIRMLDKAGILKSEYANCERLNYIREACLRGINRLIDNFQRGPPKITWGNLSTLMWTFFIG